MFQGFGFTAEHASMLRCLCGMEVGRAGVGWGTGAGDDDCLFSLEEGGWEGQLRARNAVMLVKMRRKGTVKIWQGSDAWPASGVGTSSDLIRTSIHHEYDSP